MLMLGQLGLTILVWTSLKARQDKKNKELSDELDLVRRKLNLYEDDISDDITNARNRIGLLESDSYRISNKLKRLTPVKPKTNTVNKTQTTKTKK